MTKMARAYEAGGRVAVFEGAMSVMDLPMPELADRIMGQDGVFGHMASLTELYRCCARQD